MVRIWARLDWLVGETFGVGGAGKIPLSPFLHILHGPGLSHGAPAVEDSALGLGLSVLRSGEA